MLDGGAREIDGITGRRYAAKGGVLYRIYAGPLASKADAKALCAKIKARPPNSNCLVAAD